MIKYYEVTIQHNKELDDGMLKQVKEKFIVDAISYTEAETKAYEWAEVHITGEFSLPTITKKAINELIADDEDGIFWLVKMHYETVDGDSEKQLLVKNNLLVEAPDCKTAITHTEKHLESMLVPFTITGVTITPVVEIMKEVEKGNTTS